MDEVLDHKQRRRPIVELFAPICADIDTHPAAVRTDTLGFGQFVMQRLGVEPWAYLQDVLTHLPALSSQALGEWLPDRWEAARRARLSSPTAPTP